MGHKYKRTSKTFVHTMGSSSFLCVFSELLHLVDIGIKYFIYCSVYQTAKLSRLYKSILIMPVIHKHQLIGIHIDKNIVHIIYRYVNKTKYKRSSKYYTKRNINQLNNFQITKPQRRMRNQKVLSFSPGFHLLD